MKCRDVLGVEPICKALPVVLSNCHDRHAVAQDTDKASARAKSDSSLSVKTDAV
jgi:hypothetical protein